MIPQPQDQGQHQHGYHTNSMYPWYDMMWYDIWYDMTWYDNNSTQQKMAL